MHRVEGCRAGTGRAQSLHMGDENILHRACLPGRGGSVQICNEPQDTIGLLGHGSTLLAHGQLLVNHQSTTGQLLVSCWSTISQPLVNCWSTISQPLVNCWSTRSPKSSCTELLCSSSAPNLGAAHILHRAGTWRTHSWHTQHALGRGGQKVCLQGIMHSGWVPQSLHRAQNVPRGMHKSCIGCAIGEDEKVTGYATGGGEAGAQILHRACT